MKIAESRDKLRRKYINWYTSTHNLRTDEDAKYTWWDREERCQEWCDKERTYVPMSQTKTLKIMREWVKECKKN